MEEKACNDVLEVLRGAQSAIKQRQFAALHSLSNRILHCIMVYQERPLLDVAVAIYSLNKLLEEEKVQMRKDAARFISTVLADLDDAIDAMEDRNFGAFESHIHHLLKEIQRVSRKVEMYTQSVLDFARVKKGSKLYEHGLSLGAASELTGASKWELMEASGKTVFRDESIPIEEKRIRLVRKMFHLGG